MGLIRPDVAGYLRDFPEVFLMEPNGVTGEVEKVELSQSLTTFTDRSNKVAEVLQKLREKDAFMALDGWRDEVTYFLTVNRNNSRYQLITIISTLFLMFSKQ